MNNDLYMRMQYEPCVLLVGNEYEKINKEVYNYPWNLVVTTNYDIKFSAILKNNNRMVQEITSKENMQVNLLDKKNLHVVRLLGQDEIGSNLDDMEIEDMIDKATELLVRVADVISSNGIIIIEYFEDVLIKNAVLRKAFKYLHKKQIFIFDYDDEDKYISHLVKNEIATVYKEGINEFFNLYFSDYEENYNSNEFDKINIYINSDKKGLPVSLDKNIVIETDGFCKLLNIDLINETHIPQGMYKEYFYLFLKNSVREPQWFGYRYGFNITRFYEEELYNTIKHGLDNVGKYENKLLFIVGQTGTGKSIGLASVAYKIFNDKKYPVVYINDPDVHFYSNIEYRQKEISKKGSPIFNALDGLLKSLEDKGAKAVLLAWDTSSFSTGRENSYRLYQSLLSRGRKVFMVCTAYEIKNNIISYEKDIEDEEKMLHKKFAECYATNNITNELYQLSDILKKCNLNEEEISSIITLQEGKDSSFLVFLYQIFDDLRNNLAFGVFKEANTNLKELGKYVLDDNCEGKFSNNFLLALKNIEEDLKEMGILLNEDFENSKEDTKIALEEFTKCIAICSKYKLKMPYDFSLRILGTYNNQIIKTLSKSTFFIISNDSFENYEIFIRTPLEATMYLKAKNISELDEIDCISNMLRNMRPYGEYGQQSEVRLCEKLIRIIGPNNKYYGKSYRKGYEILINELKRLREVNEIWEPILIVQEITLIREYYGRDEKIDTIERINWLKNAINISDKLLSIFTNKGLSAGTRNAIIVESANSKLLLCQLNEINDSFIYKELRRDLREVIKNDNQNYHAYVTLLKGSLLEYDREKDEVRRVELLEDLCSFADEIVLDNSDVAESDYFQQQKTNIYSRLTDTNIAQKYVDELVTNGSAAGVYVILRKKLEDNNIRFKDGISNDKQYFVCEEIYKYCKNDKYKDVIEVSEPCQYMLLNVIWLMRNKKPIFQGGECWCTCMEKETWLELLGICNNYIFNFGTDTVNSYKSGKHIKYLQALCYAQLEQYQECIASLKTIEEDSTSGIKRVYTKHMICDKLGIPKKFTGRLGKYDDINRNGTVYIDEFGKKPLYYYGPHLNISDHKEGRVFNDLEVGLSNISPKVYRNIKYGGVDIGN